MTTIRHGKRAGSLTVLALLALCGVGACGAQSVQEVPHPPELSSGQCAMNGVTCAANDECCSFWCVNGFCGTRQP
jgi:hypothetical protein